MRTKPRARRRNWSATATLVASATLAACAPAQLYPGPPRPNEELVVLVTKSPSKIVRIDGRKVNIRRAEILPGRHTLEFHGEFGELLATAGVVVGERQSRPLLKTTCKMEVESMTAGEYRFEPNAEIDERSEGPDPSYDWHRTSVDPQLLDPDGNEVDGLSCDETCRLRGRKRQSNISRACGASE